MPFNSSNDETLELKRFYSTSIISTLNQNVIFKKTDHSPWNKKATFSLPCCRIRIRGRPINSESPLPPFRPNQDRNSGRSHCRPELHCCPEKNPPLNWHSSFFSDWKFTFNSSMRYASSSIWMMFYNCMIFYYYCVFIYKK